MPIEAVLFDLGGTLIRSELTISETFQKILEWKGINVTVKDVEKALEEAHLEYRGEFEDMAGKVPFSELYGKWNAHVLDAMGVEDGNLPQEINEKWFEFCGIEIFPDVIATLDMLMSKGIKTGIISNGYEEEIHEICKMVDIKTYFDVIIGVDTIKKRKPASEIFMHALERISVKPEEAIYVGNSMEYDYYGAERVGMHSFLIMRSDTQIDEKIRYMRTLVSLNDYL
ncbi:MAG: HAD family hydrolase [Theionarchaea archaeon]|nr:HAD family hydrolase [Theionarchaea archaeon]